MLSYKRVALNILTVAFVVTAIIAVLSKLRQTVLDAQVDTGSAVTRRSLLLSSNLGLNLLRERNRNGRNENLRTQGAGNANLQPKVTVVEKENATKMINSLSMPEGSPWCQGRPTMWFVGHQGNNESPWCQNPDGSWEMSQTTELDFIDEFNAAAGDKSIDRHGCAHMDINFDGLEDIICVVGAGKGSGMGYNEVYLTAPDGSVNKVLDITLGVTKYPTMRNRLATTLQGANGKQLVFFGVKGAHPREDNEYNQHVMFRNDFAPGMVDLRPWFVEVQPDDGPWKIDSDVKCAVGSDITGNGVDDLVLCQHPQPPSIFTQSTDGEWQKLNLPLLKWTKHWQSVRVTDVTGDGVKDLVAVDNGVANSKLWIFKGQQEAPYFDFQQPWFEAELPYASPDVEVLDVNNDGRADIYVLQSNHVDGYCHGGNPALLNIWGKGAAPDPGWVPPKDTGRDQLFVGIEGETPFERVVMNFSKRGCATMAVRFGDGQSLAYGNGDMGHPGYHMFLSWNNNQ